MKILVISQNYYPDQFQINDITSSLAAQGHEVTVLTGLPDYTTSSVPREYRFFRNRKQRVDGVEILRVSTFARHHGAFCRSLNYLSFAINGSLYATFHKREFDVIFVYQLSPATMLMPAIRWSNKSGKRVLTYCLDIWPESVKAFGIRERNLSFRIIRKISRFLYQRSHRILVSSPPFLDYLTEVAGIPRGRMEYLPQYSNDANLEEDFTPLDNGVWDFLFAGNVGKFQDIECILHASAQLRHRRDFRVHILGDGSHLAAMKQMARSLDLGETVVFHGRRPGREMGEYYRLADACLVTLRGDSYIGNTIPLKLQGYMAAGKPVLGAINGGTAEIVREADCGACVAAGDSQGLADLLERFMDKPQDFAGCGERGRAYYREHFTKARFLAQLERNLRELAEQSS